MYNTAPFAEGRIEVLHGFVRQHPLAVFVTCGSEGPEVTHVPMVLHPEVGAKGVLRCHVARANSQWKTVETCPSVLAVFHGPEHYISPSWYVSKREHGKVVPTWNYVAVHVRGRARLFDDTGELMEHVKTLTDQNEQALGESWTVEDAPQEYVIALTKGIVGIEIAIDEIAGKWKASQNRPEPDRQGVVEGLTKLDSPASLRMAQIVKQRGLE